jgi:HEAT repeat protein
MVVTGAVAEMVAHREYQRLGQYAKNYLETKDWSSFLMDIRDSSSSGKSRDAVVSLLELEAVGGTDSDIFKAFSELEGASLQQVKGNAVERVMEILREQVENRHTYFLDIEAMVETPYIVLAKEILEARQRELAELEHKPSLIDVLGTFYGFWILMTDGSRPYDSSTNQQGGYRYGHWRRRTWLDEKISDSAADAVKRITGEFAEEVDMDKTYRTVGSSRVFKSRCTPLTADILANAVRLALYKVPGNRGSAAVALGKTEDSRVLPFLHQRFDVEQSRKVRIRIAEALGRVGHTDSLDLLREMISRSQRRLSKEQGALITAIGGIYSSDTKAVLLDITEGCGNSVKAAAIRALGKQDSHGLVERIKPCLKDQSRPVVRASVLALTELCDEGQEAVKNNLQVVLKRIGNDRPSRSAVMKMLGIPGVSQDQFIQDFLADRIDRLRRRIHDGRGRSSRYAYSGWYRRRERKHQRDLRETIRMVNQHVTPPFKMKLLHSIERAISVLSGRALDDVYRELGKSRLAATIVERRQVLNKGSFDQMYFV